MVNTQLLFDFFKFYCKEWIFGVDQNTLDNYLEQHSLSLREDHYAFVLEYGNSVDLLIGGTFFNCTFLDFQFTYNHFDEFLLGDLPNHSIYFGQDWSAETLCIDNLSGGLFVYDAMEKDIKIYESIQSFLFYQFLMTLWSKGKFDEVQQNIKIHDIENFLQDNEQYYIAGMDTSTHKYFLKQDKIVELHYKYSLANMFKGGVLNLLRKN